MHPTYTSDRPGDCPICNMKLVPIKPAVAVAGTNGPVVPGRVPVMISPEKQQLIGLRTATVFPRHLSDTVRTTGVLEHDETTLVRVAPRFSGWVRELHVNYTGQAVEQGHPLLTVYSPELVATETDYLLAWRRWREAEPSPEGEPRRTAQRLWESARQRLELWGIAAEEIHALEQRDSPAEEILLRAPVTGHVIAKSAVAGKAFMAGETLYELGTLHSLWVRASVPEDQLPAVRVGQQARVTFPHQPGLTLTNRVAFIYPHLAPGTRRGEFRLEIPNPEHALRPDMWTEVEIFVDLGERLTVPASAVIDTGTRQLAFVRREDDHLEPREVQIGARTDDWWEVLGGLQEGEKVVTRALFLVDSESQLKAALAGE